ncbi:MAG TPA: NAD(P)/FAD-dependent oxidoreductase [Bacteroidia bacterium]|nr:NAD(P)/FAD-dependent oxidoreductase [Bacteroidia bacterium]
MSAKKNITILGAGLVGSLLSIYLLKRGYKVTLYERRPDMRKEKIAAGRSINLALSDRGWRGLEGVGIADDIRAIGIPMTGRMIHSVDGKLTFQNYGKEGQAIFSVSRGDLNKKLMDLAEQNRAVINFNQRCTGVNLAKNEIFLEDDQGNKSSATDDLIFGADGAYSAARLQLQFTDLYNFSQTYLEHGYKELVIEAGENNSFRLEKNCLHIWPRGGYMLIALPNPDGSFTCTLFFPFKGSPSFDLLKTKNDVLKFFNGIFPDAVPLMSNLVNDFFNNPTGSLVTMKCAPWSFEKKLVLIGDAAHAIVPFYGQGMNCGFEDCTVLNQLLDEYKDDWQKVIPAYEAARKPAADAIAELAIANFIEMRDLVGHPDFLLRKKIESRFAEKHPDKWIPLYTMVTFSHLPYNEAQKRGKKQDKIMEQVMNWPGIEKKWDSEEVEKLILEMI